ncbi:MAG: hypothetical protein JRD93_17825 [Deltaproteobacteria bacterium]|nr:hypothetical protein [Deltaproteobacteria bacterium]
MAKASFAKDFAIAKNAPAFPVGVNAFVGQNYFLGFWGGGLIGRFGVFGGLLTPPRLTFPS